MKRVLLLIVAFAVSASAAAPEAHLTVKNPLHMPRAGETIVLDAAQFAQRLRAPVQVTLSVQ